MLKRASAGSDPARNLLFWKQVANRMHALAEEVAGALPAVEDEALSQLSATDILAAFEHAVNAAHLGVGAYLCHMSRTQVSSAAAAPSETVDPLATTGRSW